MWRFLTKVQFIIICVSFIPGSLFANCFMNGVKAIESNLSQDATLIFSDCNDPEISDYILFYKSKALLNAGRAKEAVEPINLLLSKYRKFPMTLSAKKLKAEILYEAGMPKASAHYLKKYLRRRRGTFDNYILLSKSWKASGYRNYAISALMKAVDRISKPADWKTALDMLYAYKLKLSSKIAEKATSALFNSGYWNKSGELVDFYLKRWPNDSGFRLIKGKVLYRSNRFIEAENVFLSLMKTTLGSTRTSAMNWLSRTYSKQDKFAESVAIKKKLHKNSRGRKRWRQRYLIASLWQDAKEYDKALYNWKRLLTAHGRGASKYRGLARWGIGWALYQQGRYVDANNVWIRLSKLSSDVRYVGEDKVKYWIARAYDNQGQSAKAATIYNELQDSRDYYPMLSKWRLEGKSFEGVPWPKKIKSKCIKKKYKSTMRWDELEGADDALRYDLLGDASLSAAKKALDSKIYDVAYRIGRSYLKPYPDLYPGQGLECLIWNASYPKPYKKLIKKITEGKIKPELVWAMMMTESAFRKDAVSPVGRSRFASTNAINCKECC